MFNLHEKKCSINCVNSEFENKQSINFQTKINTPSKIMSIQIRRPPPKKQVQEPTIHVKWIRLPLSTNSIFNKLPDYDIQIEDTELVSYEKKAIQPKNNVEMNFLLEIKKYNAINIAFSRVNYTDEEMINEIMLNRSLDDNLIKVLFQYFPSEEEFLKIEQEINLLDTVELKNFEELENKLKKLNIKKNTKFSRGEVFFKKIMKIKKEFYEHLENINLLFYLNDCNLESNFELIINYYKSVLQSEPFQYLILILLKIGNKCNKHEIKAFKLSTVE